MFRAWLPCVSGYVTRVSYRRGGGDTLGFPPPPSRINYDVINTVYLF